MRSVRTANSHFLLTAAAALTAVAIAPAQVRWSRPTVEPRDLPRLAMDFASGRVLMFGGQATVGSPLDTALWDGAQWTRPSLTVQPLLRNGHAMATDTWRQRIVLFGGFDSSSTLPNQNLDDTWLWDGQHWQQSSAVGPSRRNSHAMAFDLARGVVVLFGGFDGSVPLDDTWEWNGSSWRLRQPVTSPPRRYAHAMAFDLLRFRTVLHGGTPFSVPMSDTWEWDGTNWLQRTPSPSPRVSHELVFDVARGTMLVLGGMTATGVAPAAPMTWNGSTWSTLTVTGNLPPARVSFDAVYDWARARTVTFGGHYVDGASRGVQPTDVWEWDGSAWSLHAGPAQRFEAALVHEPTQHRLVMFGGSQGLPGGTMTWIDDMWELRGTEWRELHPTSRPSPRGGAAFAFDAARGNAILFGGGAGLGDTWRWNGLDWTQLQPAATPPGRYGAAMVYDSVRRELVMFGGATSTFVHLDDTWIWNGSTWSQRNPTTRPSPRRAHAFAFDPLRQRGVLFGGTHDAPFTFSSPLADTWEWDGANWQFMPTPSVLGRWGATAAYDPAQRGVILLLGGTGAGLAPPQRWTGSQWVDVPLAAGGPSCTSPSATFDPDRHSIVVFGGSSTYYNLAEDWSFGFAHPAAAEPTGSGCAGVAGLSSLTAADVPWLGSSVPLQIAPVPSGALTQLAIGFSDTSDGGTPLPRALAGIGLPTCTQYVSIDQLQAATASGTTAAATLSIPSSPSLTGLPFFCQAVAADPSANALGFVVSNALACLIGSP